MERINSKLLFCKTMLMINTAFWFAIAILYSTGKHDLPRHLIISILLFMEVILCVGAYLAVVKRWRLGIFLAMLLALSNAVLALIDQQGILDSVGMILSLLALTSLILVRKDIRNEK
ncbi:hypothetical protein K8S19_04760 [bacterium]|nr:hypothetical protein [bacterium]